MDAADQPTDYCTVPLSGVRDEGPLIAAAGFLTTGCKAEEAGQCGPHPVLPILYCLRFSAELCFHGCTQALEEGRNCSGRTEEKTHDLRALFSTWEKNLSDSSRRLGWYLGRVPDVTAIWESVEILHDLDPDGTCLRYPTKMPTESDVCTILETIQHCVERIVDVTAALVPGSKADCRKRLAFLRAVA